MAFSSLFFVFLFLPVSLLIYYLVPAKFRKLPLIALSLLFYAWGNPVYLPLLLLSMAYNYFAGLQLGTAKEAENPRRAKRTLVLAVIVNLALLVFFKYAGFLVSNLNLLGLKLSAPATALPLGLSFYTFTVLSYLFDIYRDRAQAQKNVLSFALYASFFAKISSGPIVQYKDMEAQLSATHRFSLDRLGGGIRLFFVGLFKKVLLSDGLGALFDGIAGLSAMSVGTAWLGMILYSFRLYFDFSGYSDMAIGIAKMFGYDFAPNFDYPYMSKNISEFWRRWHISLGAWFRDYVYIPLGGSRCSKGKIFRNLLVVWLLTGIWHGADWTFILWGLWHGFFAVMERFVIKDKLDRVPTALRVFGTFLIVSFGWVMFFSPSLSSMGSYFAQMFGAGGLGVFDSTFAYYFRSSLLLLIPAIIGASPLPKLLHDNLVYRAKGRLGIVLSAAGSAILLLVCTACMVGATYTSFLYFQF